MSDAPALSALLRSQSPDYVRFFTPFRFEQEQIARLLSERRRDVWIGFSWQGSLIGFFLLRGWDEGYDVPAYGVLIDEKFSGHGFGRLSLMMAKSIGKLRRARRLMLKVHPQNHAARILFERASFARAGIDSETGQFLYYFELPRRATKP